MAHLAAQRYAKAFFNQSLESNAIDTSYHNLHRVYMLTNESKEFNDFLKNPIIPLEKKRAILSELFEKNLNTLTYRFISFLAEKKRLNCLKAIYENFEALYLKHKNILKARITTSIALTQEARAANRGQPLPRKPNMRDRIPIQAAVTSPRF